jgi:hypothetical protein
MQDMQIVDQLLTVGWQVKKGGRTGLVKTSASGAVHCVDGRLADQTDEVMRGPKIQGGVLGVMALGLKRGDEAAVKEAMAIIQKAGFIAGVHGDDHHGVAGCGFGKLWRQKALSGLPELTVSLERVKEIVTENGGVYIELKGGHEEKVVRVNMVANMTLAPDGSGFGLDLWVAAKLGIEPDLLLKNAAETVEKLNGPKIIEVIQ